MTCEQFADVAVDVVDGRLEGPAAGEAARHLETCPLCRALVADLGSIRTAAGSLDRLEPPARVWTRIEDRLVHEGPASRTFLPRSPRAWRIWGVAAAALVAITIAGVMSLSPGGSTPTTPATPGADGELVASVQSDLEAAEAHYQKAIDGLEQIAHTGSTELDPQVAAVLQKNLQVIDRAIVESRAALRNEPASPDVQEGLFDAMRAKVALLQQTVELINEMRKGNSAEAGRIIQGLK